MLRTCILMVLLAANVVSAETPPPASAPAAMRPPTTGPAELLRLQEMVRHLDETTPVMRQMQLIDAQLAKLRATSEAASAPLLEEAEKLQASEAWQAFMREREALQEQYREAAGRVRDAMAEAARALYASRHEELRARAVKDTPAARGLGLDVLTYPRVDGSTSTHPLAVIIASRVLDVPYTWLYPEPVGYAGVRAPAIPRELVIVSGRASSYDPSHSPELHLIASRVIAEAPGREQERLAAMINTLLAQSSGTHESYEALIENRADLILTARAPSADEKKLAAEKGVRLETKPIARDALVFIVNHKNPTTNLTLEQIRSLYRRALDGEKRAEGQLRPLIRERNSGSRELFDELVMNNQPLPTPEREWPHLLYVNGMGGPYSRATEDANALGYTVYYYEHFMAMSPYTRTIAIDGVEPTAETIRSGKYPLVTPVYAAYREDEPADSPAMKLLGWLLSDEGQAVVRESGYVGVR